MSRLSSWRRDGSPWHLAQPLADLAGALRRHGYTIGAIGNDAHLGNDLPEDHTPFSTTGWPSPNPYPWVHAIDIMPPRPGSGLPSLAQLGAQISRDRRAGHHDIGWLKYANWTTAAGQCVHEAWRPAYIKRNSGDRGHIHLSARTDWTHAHSAYDPVVRLHGQATPVPGPATPSAPTPLVPPFTRTLTYSQGRPMLRGADVRLWQGRMRQRGWAIAVDGLYGAESCSACKKFQREKGLTVDGIVGPRTWTAAWTAPVTA